MTRLAAVLCLLSAPATAQNWGDHTPPDEWTIERVGPDEAYVDYYNADPPASGAYPQSLTVGDLTVDIEILTSAGPETIIVTPPEGWLAIPFALDVADGDIGRIRLLRGQYHGN